MDSQMEEYVHRTEQSLPFLQLIAFLQPDV